MRRREEYDVCIIGSGAGGGMAAHVLTEAGVNVVMLEAGGMWDNATDSDMLTPIWQSPRRGRSIPERQFGEFNACIGGWTLEGEPYTLAPDTQFDWWRARMLGGRTNHWGRISLRFGVDDFQRRTLDGLGDDWPITYEDIRPYYDRLDRRVGIFGSVEGRRNDPDGIFQPPPRPRCYELLVKRAAERLDIPCIPARLSILTRPLNGRSACHYCGQCNRGCRTNANFSSPNVFILPALAGGQLTLITEAMAREVTVDSRGRADGVSYIDKRDGSEQHVRARVVVLAASACESARLLLNSKSSLFPEGLANSSGTVGRYLTDTVGTTISGFIPTMADPLPHNEEGAGGGHVYIPWWGDNQRLDFPRGYHLEVFGGLGPPSSGFMGGIHRYPVGGGYGAQLKDAYRRYFGTTIGFFGRGEMIPNQDSYCEIDPDGEVDRWGIPALRFHFKWTDHEINQARHMQESCRELIESMGGEVFAPMPTREQGYGILPGGRIIHEMGVTRMGGDASSSVVDAHCRAHDVPNLFVADAGPFVTHTDKNPTWTIMALAWRTSEYILEQSRQGVL